VEIFIWERNGVNGGNMLIFDYCDYELHFELDRFIPAREPFYTQNPDHPEYSNPGDAEEIEGKFYMVFPEGKKVYCFGDVNEEFLRIFTDKIRKKLKEGKCERVTRSRL
jgi:hypothetical protein